MGSRAATADLKLTLWLRTALNTSFLCLYLLSRITGVGHHRQQHFVSESSLTECQKRKSILLKPTVPEQLDIYILKWQWIPFLCHIENLIKLWAKNINCLDANIGMDLNGLVREHCPWYNVKNTKKEKGKLNFIKTWVFLYLTPRKRQSMADKKIFTNHWALYGLYSENRKDSHKSIIKT